MLHGDEGAARDSSGRERVPLAHYLRWIALASTDQQLINRLTALAEHFEALRQAGSERERTQTA